MNSQTFTKLEEIKDKAVKLYQGGVIKKCTKNFFIRNYEQLREEIEYYRTGSIEISDPNLKRTLSHLIFLSAILERMERKEKVGRTYEEYFLEIFNKLGNFSSIDLWIINLKSGVGLSPFCYYHISQKDLSFILVTSKAPNYITQDLIGLLAHEASHIYEPINRFHFSLKSEKRRVGESLADLLGFILTDSLFLHSATYFIKNIIGLENSAVIRPRHLSWAARMIVLNYLNKLIWQDEKIRDKKDVYFKDLSDGYQRISPLEESVITISTLEGKSKIGDFAKFKINENTLINIKNLTLAELETSGKIIQFIYKIEVPT